MLTDRAIKAAKPAEKDYKLTDQLGLYLKVTKAGKKLWRYRYKWDGKDKNIGLGEYPYMSLMEARLLHEKLYEGVKMKIAPQTTLGLSGKIEEADNFTFSDLFNEWCEAKGVRLAERTMRNYNSLYTHHIKDAIGGLVLSDITTKHVLQILDGMKEKGLQPSAMSVRGLISRVFRYGGQTMRCDGDPAAILTGYIDRPQVQHARNITRSEMKPFLESLSVYEGRFVSAYTLTMHILMCLRASETVSLEWGWVDHDEMLIRIPSDVMKMNRPHIVPITKVMKPILDTLKLITGHRVHVFPNTRDHRRHCAASGLNSSIRNVLKMADGVEDITSHDFRATASTWMNEAHHHPHAVDMQLAHSSKGKVEGTYNQAEYLDLRRDALEWYHNELYSLCPDAFDRGF